MSMVANTNEINSQNVSVYIDGGIYNGKKYHPYDDLLVRIPSVYAYMFEGKHFTSRDHFNQTIMFATCAEEAYFAGKRSAWLQDKNERIMKAWLDKCY